MSRRDSSSAVLSLSSTAMRSGNSLRLPALADGGRRPRLVQILRHLEMMLERGQGLDGPVLQVCIISALGVALEQVDGVLVGTDLDRVEIGAEVLAACALELVELALVRTVEGRGQ